MDDTTFTFVCRRKGDRRRRAADIGEDRRDGSLLPENYPDQNIDLFTSREQEVLLQLVDGRTDMQIAEYLNLSQKTVQHHVGALLAKIGAKNRTQAVVKALYLGLVEIQGTIKNGRN